MKLTPLHDPKDGQLRIAGFMSGSGTNLRAIINNERELAKHREKPPYTVCCIFSDDVTSKAAMIGREFDLPVFYRDIRTYYDVRAKPLRDMAVRAEFDAEIMRMIDLFGAQAIACAGYMSIVSDVLTASFTCVNVHPGDLSVVDDRGNRKYTGDRAVRKAIYDGAKELRSSTILLEPATTDGKIDPKKIDNGKLLMISPALEVRLDKNFDFGAKALVQKAADEHQSMLKEIGDWKIFPQTLQYIAEGRYQNDEKGNLYFEGSEIPNGVRL